MPAAACLGFSRTFPPVAVPEAAAREANAETRWVIAETETRAETAIPAAKVVGRIAAETATSEAASSEARASLGSGNIVSCRRRGDGQGGDGEEEDSGTHAWWLSMIAKWTNFSER
jgi:hypothetical protein